MYPKIALISEIKFSTGRKCLFLDELNACSHEVQKVFYSLIHERRLGEYYLPKGFIKQIKSKY